MIPGDSALSQQQATAVLDDAIVRWADRCRSRIPGFVQANFGLMGSLRLHALAIGWDILRAPVNALASVLTALKGLVALVLSLLGMRRSAAWLRRLDLLLFTRVGRELEWRLQTELLGLPLEQRRRVSTRDLLLEELRRDPRVTPELREHLTQLGDRTQERAFRRQLRQATSAYVGSRAAAADISINCLAVLAGWLLYRQLTPGTVGLSGSLAGTLAHEYAVRDFWAGDTLGALYYGIVGVDTSALLQLGVFCSLLVPVALLSTFSGVLTDPAQRLLGMHQRRLRRMIDSLEAALRGGAGFYEVRDHYVARLIDVADWTQAALRIIR